MNDWIQWWDVSEGKNFHAFIRFYTPQTNQVEVIHAWCKHHGKMALSLFECFYFDLRDSILPIN